MSTIFPQVKSLKRISDQHESDAKNLLNLINDFLKEEKQAHIEIHEGKKYSYAFIILPSDEIEGVFLELRCRDYKFSIVVTNHLDGMNTSTFKYNIPTGEEMYNRIPNDIRECMVRASINLQPVKWIKKI